jgi:hypothetical protein
MALKDQKRKKKKLRTPLMEKCNDIGTADLVIPMY